MTSNRISPARLGAQLTPAARGTRHADLDDRPERDTVAIGIRLRSGEFVAERSVAMLCDADDEHGTFTARRYAVVDAFVSRSELVARTAAKAAR